MRLVDVARLSAVAALLVATSGGVSTAGQVTGETGRELFVNYCASCHGVDGKGSGPTAHTLKIQPADLTTIAKRRGGAFPTALIRSRIAGPDNMFIAAHGSSEMPVWGPIFRALDPAGDNEGRVSRIVAYVESLQSK